MLTIYDQLKDYCNCLRVNDVQSLDFNKNIDLLIDLISSLTCWKNNPCETFLSSDREEVFDVGMIHSCYCDNNLLILELRYKEIKKETITVKLQIREGIKFTEIEVSPDDFDFNVYENKLYIDLSNYSGIDPCNCINLHKVIIQYVAGYNLIPECLLPVFCDYLQYVIQMNRCDCNCVQCEEKVENEEPVEPDTVSEYIQNSIFVSYARQLETISICKSKIEFRGLVV